MRIALLVSLLLVVVPVPGARATPSTAFWSAASTYVQPFAVPHVTYDTYFATAGAYAIDTGLTVGLLPFEKVQAELGFDVNLPGELRDGFLLNAKVGLPDGAFGAWFPGISVGIWGVGTRKDVSTYNILHAEIGKTFFFGNLTVGGYYGLSKTLLVDEFGSPQQAGFAGSYTSPDVPLGRVGLDKLVFVADVQTGKSALGGAGGGVALFVTPAVSLLTGPVFFLNREVQPGRASWMWSLQLDVDLDLGAAER